MSIILEEGKLKQLDVSLTPSGAPIADYIRGYVKDASTSVGIPNATINLDGAFASYTEGPGPSIGYYLIREVPYGTHAIIISANNYQSATFEINVEEQYQWIDFELEPIAPVEGWPADISIVSVTADPAQITIGDEIKIHVNVDYPYPKPLPYTFSGTIVVDGQSYTEEITIQWRNPRVTFVFTPTEVGTFTAVARNKTATFEVLPVIAGQFYSPFYGEKRAPIAARVLYNGQEVELHESFYPYGPGRCFFTGEEVLKSEVSVLEWEPSYATIQEWDFASGIYVPWSP